MGRRWDENWARAISRLAWVRYSIDAGNGVTYKKIRNVPDWHFDCALEAISRTKKLVARPVIGAGFVVTEDNWQEVHAGVQLVRHFGADNVRISAQFSTEDEKRFSSFAKECAALCQKAVTDFHDDSFQVYNRFSEKLSDLTQKRPDYETCWYQQATTYIGADLNVYRCCVLAYNEHGIVGNLNSKSFKDLWMSQERFDEMRAFDAKSCERCQFNGINRNLEYIMRPSHPLHAEFV